MSFVLDRLERLSERTMKTLQRYPMASFSAFLVTIILINLVELQNYSKDNPVVIALTKIAFVTSLGVVLFPALRLLKPHGLMIALGIGLLGGYYYILPLDVAASGSNVFVRHLFLMVAFFIMLIWAPFSLLKISNRNIWEWTQNLIVALVSAVFFSLILFGGLSLALFAISRLFEFDIPSWRYTQLAILVFGFYGVNIFLSQVPKYVLLLQTKTYSKAEIIFTKYILTPLALGYFAILYAYTFKVLFTMQWPNGILAWIIAIFSLVAILTYLFWTPLVEEGGVKYKRYVWMAILFQALMMGVAIWMRIETYGITESRYFIALFGIWLVMMSLYFIIVSQSNYKWLFLTLSVLLVGSQFGKFSAAEVAKRSQQERLQMMIQQTQPLDNRNNIKSRYEISNAIDYLYNVYGIESLETTLPDVIKAYNEQNTTTKEQSYFPHFATQQLGFTYVDSIAYEFENLSGDITFHASREVLDVEGYKWFVRYDTLMDEMMMDNIAKQKAIWITRKDNLLLVQEKEITTSCDLTALASKLVQKEIQTNSPDQSIDSQELEPIYETKNRKIKLLIDMIALDKKQRVKELHGIVLIAEK